MTNELGPLPEPFFHDSKGYTAEQVRAEVARAVAAERAKHAGLLEALQETLRNFPTDFDMRSAGWGKNEIEAACDAYDKGREAIAQAHGQTP